MTGIVAQSLKGSFLSPKTYQGTLKEGDAWCSFITRLDSKENNTSRFLLTVQSNLWQQSLEQVEEGVGRWRMYVSVPKWSSISRWLGQMRKSNIYISWSITGDVVYLRLWKHCAPLQSGGRRNRETAAVFDPPRVLWENRCAGTFMAIWGDGRWSRI